MTASVVRPGELALAAALLLTHCGCSLGDFFWLAGFCVLMISMQSGWRPPGAIFFLLRRRKNMERKTPRRAGCSPPYVPTPLGGGRGCSRTLYVVPGRLVTASVVRPGVLAACRCAVAYALRWGLDGFFRGWKSLRLNDFHAKGLPPSGGHILSSPAKKEYGKKDAAQGGVFPALRTHPLGWVSRVQPHTVRGARQICDCIRHPTW